MRAERVIVMLALAALWPATGFAHENRPLFVELEEQATGSVALRWRVPPSVTADNQPTVAIGGCEAVGFRGTAGSGQFAREFRCEGGVAERRWAPTRSYQASGRWCGARGFML